MSEQSRIHRAGHEGLTNLYFLGLGSSLIADNTEEDDPSSSTTMRYYEQKYPEVDELVMVQVRQIAEMGAYVKLVRSNPNRTD